MKKSILAVSFAAIAILSCKTPEEFRAEDPVYDQLLVEAQARDSAMLELVTTINLIDESISQISEKEAELEIHANDPEYAEDNRERILEEIQEIYEMMEQNKNKIAELNSRLAAARDRINKSEVELKHANELIAQYQLMIDNLNAKIEAKDAQIAGLEGQLAKINISLDSLVAEYEVQKEDLNRVFYAFGTRKELTEKNVLDKTGGFIGIGKTYKLKSDFDRSFFTEADQLELKEIELYVKSARIVTNHIDGSYHLTGEEKKVEKLIIDNPEKFWESSKYLVIEVEQ